MFNILLFAAGAVLMFWMGARSAHERRQLCIRGERVEAKVEGLVTGREGEAYVLGFSTAGGSHRLHYPKPRRGRGWAVGSGVVLYYDPDHPEKMYVEGDRSVLGAEALYGALGLLLLALAVVLVVLAL